MEFLTEEYFSRIVDDAWLNQASSGDQHEDDPNQGFILDPNEVTDLSEENDPEYDYFFGDHRVTYTTSATDNSTSVITTGVSISTERSVIHGQTFCSARKLVLDTDGTWQPTEAEGWIQRDITNDDYNDRQDLLETAIDAFHDKYPNTNLTIRRLRTELIQVHSFGQGSRVIEDKPAPDCILMDLHSVSATHNREFRQTVERLRSLSFDQTDGRQKLHRFHGCSFQGDLYVGLPRLKISKRFNDV